MPSPDLIIPSWEGVPAHVHALLTTRRGGVSTGPYAAADGSGGLNLATHVGDREQDVARNRALLRAGLPSEPAWLEQVHGAAVVDAAQATQPLPADAAFTSAPGVVCAIMTADCLPVLFSDRAGRVVGAAHGGWRGLAAGVLENTVARMRLAGAGEITAWLGPAIGPRRFQVGPEVREAFLGRDAASEAAFVPDVNGKYLADIYRLARLALGAVGVTQVSGGDFCTVDDALRFYSYRRDGVTGRMAALVWIGTSA